MYRGDVKNVSAFVMRKFIGLYKLLSVTAILLAMMLGGCASKKVLSDAGAVLGGVVEGVLTRKDVKVSDMVGQWNVEGSAVTFQSESFLKRAGGVATAAAVEQKLNPYFKQYGLTGATMQINANGNFKLGLKYVTLDGVIAKNTDGTFTLTFLAFGAIPVAEMPAYVQCPPGKLEILFEATKLKDLMSVVARFSGMQMAGTIATILDSYEGMCVGLSMDRVSAQLPSGATVTVDPSTKPSGNDKTQASTSTASKRPTAANDAGKSGRQVLLEMVRQK